MDYQEIINKTKPEFDKAIEYLKKELSEVRASRPSAGLLESLSVNCFGKNMPLNSLSLVSQADSQSVTIQPWDVSYIEPIQKALGDSPLGLSMVSDGVKIRVSFPPMTEDIKKKMVQLLAEKGDNVRRTIRHWRQEGRQKIDDGFENKELREDDRYKGKEKLDELAGDYNDKIEEMMERKKKEIMG